MNYQEAIKKNLVSLIMLVAAALAIALIVSIFVGDEGQDAGAQLPDISIGKIVDVEGDKLPDKFPADIPLEAEAPILQNYNLTAENGDFQATRVFETKKTLSENFALYSTYLKNGQWTLNSSSDEPKLKVLSASRDKDRLLITFTETEGSNTVNISFTKLK